MRVARIGFTPLKGGRHVEQPVVDLGPEGPVGDRVLCLVDPARDRVLRTVEHPTLVRAVAALDGPRLTVRLGADRWQGVPAPTGDVRTVDYWGREAKVELLAGPWAGPLSEHLGLEVALARPARADAVVYGGPVSLVTTSSLHRLSAEVGAPVEGARFRPTFVVDTGTAAPYVEDHWAGRELSVGSAVVRVRGPVPRCAVVDLDPVSGARDAAVLRTLAGYRRGQGPVREPAFGVDAEIVRPGRVTVDDLVSVGRTD